LLLESEEFGGDSLQNELGIRNRRQVDEPDV